MSYRTFSRVALMALLPARLIGQTAAITLYETTDCPVPDVVKPYTIIARYDPARSRDSSISASWRITRAAICAPFRPESAA